MSERRIILAGGSGYLGGLLARKFAGEGAEVVILTRRPKASGPAVREVAWDGRNSGPWEKELDGAAAVINLTGRSVNCRYTQENRKLILESRVDSTKAVGEAIGRCANPPPVWLNASTATIYKHSFDRPMDETAECASDKDAKDEFSVEVAQAWEAALNQAQTPKTRKIPFRLSMVLGPEKGTVYRVLRRLVRLGLGGKLASGRQYVAWIHQEDFCGAMDWLLSNPNLEGPFNVAAPDPLPNRELMKILRQQLGMPFGLPATRWMMEIGAFIMRTETELVLKSRRVIPGRLLASGFQFHFPQLVDAVREIETRI
jgi:uncharacterized protein (TIGR01777 family)